MNKAAENLINVNNHVHVRLRHQSTIIIIMYQQKCDIVRSAHSHDAYACHRSCVVSFACSCLHISEIVTYLVLIKKFDVNDCTKSKHFE